MLKDLNSESKKRLLSSNLISHLAPGVKIHLVVLYWAQELLVELECRFQKSDLNLIY